MSDISALSHEYQTSAKLAEELNEAILILKKARLHRRSGLNQEQRHRLANTLGACGAGGRTKEKLLEKSCRKKWWSGSWESTAPRWRTFSRI